MIDGFLLARIQFAANITFHILFPTITLSLCWMLLYFKMRFNSSADKTWMNCYKFWVKIFALSFALGIVSGITMSFQFGTNWPGFMEVVGNVAGPLLAYEVMTAFFLEATFLGIMLFGSERVSNRVHTISTFLVCIGTSASAFWILTLNSWMQTPSGIEMVDGKAIVTDWFEVIFNPSMPYRIIHMSLASILTACFLIAGVSSYQLLCNNKFKPAKYAIKAALIIAAIVTPVQIIVGDIHGLNTVKYQPAKIAAIEAVWNTKKGVPLVLFAWPNEITKTNNFVIEIPKLASLILTHDFDGKIKGINDFEHAPPVKPLFFGFRIMVGIGILMLLASCYGVYIIFRDQRYGTRFLQFLYWMSFSGWVATLAGWYVTEIGRQPYLVQGILKTADAVSEVPPENIALSLIGYLVTYLILIIIYIRTVFYLASQAVDKNHNIESDININPASNSVIKNT